MGRGPAHPHPARARGRHRPGRPARPEARLGRRGHRPRHRAGPDDGPDEGHRRPLRGRAATPAPQGQAHRARRRGRPHREASLRLGLPTRPNPGGQPRGSRGHPRVRRPRPRRAGALEDLQRPQQPRHHHQHRTALADRRPPTDAAALAQLRRAHPPGQGGRPRAVGTHHRPAHPRTRRRPADRPRAAGPTTAAPNRSTCSPRSPTAASAAAPWSARTSTPTSSRTDGPASTRTPTRAPTPDA